MGGDDPLVALSTVGSREDAERIGNALVDGRLAACVNIVPGLRSIYWWQGAVTADDEHLLLIKTTRWKLDALRERLLAIHPYEVPEFVVLEVAEIADAYREWLLRSVSYDQP